MKLVKYLSAAAALSAALCLLPELHAQSETDAVRNGSIGLGGSARYRSMAGAFGAVGVDFSSVQQNPAGIALNRRYMGFSATTDMNWFTNNASWYGNKSNARESAFTLSELSFTGAVPLENDLGFSYGLGYHRKCNFDRTVNVSAASPGATIADYAAAMLNNMQHNTGQLIGHDAFGDKDVWSNGNLPWSDILAWQGGWIDSYDPKGGVYFPRFVYDGSIAMPSSADMYLREQGSASAYDAAFGFNYGDLLYLGMSVNMASINFNSVSEYRERYNIGNRRDQLLLRTGFTTSGFGAGVGIGAIAEPVRGLRLGLAYYSPLWYTLTRSYRAEASSVYTGDRALKNDKGEVQAALSIEAPDGSYTYAYRSPGRLVASLAYIYGNSALVSFDYEYRNMGKNILSALGEARNPYEYDNIATGEDFGAEHTLRIGAEVRPTKRLSLRAGYMCRMDFIKNKNMTDFSAPAKQEVLVVQTAPHYVMPGRRSALTGGLGFRLTPAISADLSVIWEKQTSHLYTFPYINDAGPQLGPGNEGKAPAARLGQKPIALTDSGFGLAFTLGYRL